MLKALRVLSACALITALAAPMASANNIVGDTVTLRTLDKVTAQTKDFDVKVGDSLDYGSLRIDVKHCDKTKWSNKCLQVTVLRLCHGHVRRHAHFFQQTLRQ